MNQSHFEAPKIPIESGKLSIPHRLAEHLEMYGKIAEEARTNLTPGMQAVLQAMTCTDKIALRTAEIQKNLD